MDSSGGAPGRGPPGQDAIDDLPPWVTSSEVMSPLLTAYDARIQVQAEPAKATVGHRFGRQGMTQPARGDLCGVDGTGWDGIVR